MVSFEFGNISPHIILSSDRPAAWKMIKLHILRGSFNVSHFNIPCPLEVPLGARSNSEARHFKCINNTIISMGGVTDLESHLTVWIQVFLLYQLTLFGNWPLFFQKGRVLEENNGLSPGKRAFH